MVFVAQTALLPHAAPFGDAERAALEGVLSGATATQRAWLAGFLTGLDAAQAIPAAPPRATEPLTILYATEGGNAERLAGDVAKAAKKAGMKPRLIDMADLAPADLAGAKNLVAIASTWGEGEPPGRAAHGYAALMADASLRLDGVRFSVLALGDTAYSEFCAIGRALDARFEALGGVRVAERVDCDLDYAAPAAAWIDAALLALAPARPAADNVVQLAFAPRDKPDVARELTAEVVAHVNLNSSRSSKETVHVALDFGDAAPDWEPGDSLEIFPHNDPALVDELVHLTGLAADVALRARLTTERDITTLTPPALDRFAAIAGLELPDEPRAWIKGRQLIDLIALGPTHLTAEQLTSLTRPLPPRAYSIASSRAETDTEAHLLVAAVRYDARGRARKGVASTWVADTLRVGREVRARVKPNRHFRLPDPATDIVMVGPGTGVAPFRAFVQERRATAAPGRNWLVFGDRRYTHDFLYQLEWQAALADGSLTRLDLAFSRDAPAKVYVQDKLWSGRRELVDWLEGGAHFYVCGDANHMAKDVRAMLVRVMADVKALAPEAAEAAVADLERGHRYLTDVY